MQGFLNVNSVEPPMAPQKQRKRLVFILCGTYLTKNLPFWYKSYDFVDLIKFLRTIQNKAGWRESPNLANHLTRKQLNDNFFPAREHQSATRQLNPVAQKSRRFILKA
jgi:hypothetical protein